MPIVVSLTFSSRYNNYTTENAIAPGEYIFHDVARRRLSQDNRYVLGIYYWRVPRSLVDDIALLSGFRFALKTSDMPREINVIF